MMSGCRDVSFKPSESPSPPSILSEDPTVESGPSPIPAPTPPHTVTLGAEEFPIDSTSLALTIVPPGARGVHAEELPKLSAFSQLTRLELREDRLEEGIPLSSLAAAPSLTELVLAFHRGSLEGLEHCTQLTELYLLDCADLALPTLTLDELKNCDPLTRLHLLDCSNFSLPPLALEGLYLSRCGEIDWLSLGKLTRLDLLSLDDNFPGDMSFLTSVPGLKSLILTVHFDVFPDSYEREALPITLLPGDEIPDWVPGDRESMARFLEQPERSIVIHRSPFCTSDCNYCNPK